MSLSLQLLQDCLSKVQVDFVLKEDILEGTQKCIASSDMNLKFRSKIFTLAMFGLFLSTLIFSSFCMLYIHWGIAELFEPPRWMTSNDALFLEILHDVYFTRRLPNYRRPGFTLAFEAPNVEDSSDDSSIDISIDISTSVADEEVNENTSALNPPNHNISSITTAFESAFDLAFNSVNISIDGLDSGLVIPSGESTQVNTTDSVSGTETQTKSEDLSPISTTRPEIHRRNDTSVNESQMPAAMPAPVPVPPNEAKLSFDITTETGRAAMRDYLKEKMASQATEAV